MKIYCSVLIFVMALISISTDSYADTLKIIKLKDGSTIKGKVLQLENGIYTLETSNLGEMNIDESDILSITSQEFLEKPTTTSSTQKAELQKQVQQIQGTILADEEVIAEIQNLLEDDNIKAMLSDPKLLEDVISFDRQKIEQNTSIQDLMNNPKMRNLINKIQQKILAQ